MTVLLAAVRWVCANRVGLEFIRSSAGDQDRLAAFVRRHGPRTSHSVRGSSKWGETVMLLGASGD
jgi:hypothetical protein